MNLNTTYLGLSLKNPLIVGATPLSDSLGNIVAMADCGAAAIVLRSLFEENLAPEERTTPSPTSIDLTISNEKLFYLKRDLEGYCNHIRSSKRAVTIPIIASVNVLDYGAWKTALPEIERSGADAIEITIFHLGNSFVQNSVQVEEKFCEAVKALTAMVKIPVSIKLSNSFTALPNFVTKLSATGIKGVVLFNRSFRYVIDTVDCKSYFKNAWLTIGDPGPSLFWLSNLSGKTSVDLCGSTGVYEPGQAIEYLLCGATTVQLASILYRKGIFSISEILAGVRNWMHHKKIGSIDDFRGKLAISKSELTFDDHRHEYIKTLADFQ